MREEFHEYFKPTEAQIRGLWANALFSFDASVLLNVYGYSDDTCQDLVAFFEKFAERIRLPHQFGLEFSRNRASVIVRQVHNYLTAERELTKILKVHFLPKRDHPYLSEEAMTAFMGIQQELADSRTEMERLLSEDVLCDRMLKTFEGKIGLQPTREEYEKLHKTAQDRYAAQIPPGYCDLKAKPVPQAYGDYIAWRQLIEIAKTEKRDIILAIDDEKEDWWQIEHERPVGPKPELLKEFAEESNQRVYLYNSFSFLRAAKLYGAADIEERVLREVESRLESQREAKSAAAIKVVPSPVPFSEVKLDPLTSERTAAEALKVAPAASVEGESLKADAKEEGK